MKIWLIVDKSTNRILNFYFSNDVRDSSAYWDHSWCEPLAFHVECPASLDPKYVKWNGEAVIIDQEKVDKKLNEDREEILTKIRQYRDDALKYVDVLINEVVLGICYYSAVQVKDHRAYLLNITEPYKVDPSLLDSVNMDELINSMYV